MRFLIPLIILLMSAICSCRSSKQTALQTADSTAIDVSEVKASISAEEVLTLINTSTDIDLEGITVEFYPPDTAHPDARAAPKSLNIASARARNDTQAAQHEAAAAIEKDTVNVSIERATEQTQHTRADNDILYPSDWVIIFSLLGAIAILFIILIINQRRNGTM